MTQTMTNIYKQKPLRYLWPIVIIVCLVAALWAQFPWNLNNVPPQSAFNAQRTSPAVAYTTIDEASINQLVKRAASEWMLGSRAKEKRRSIDLTTLETSLEAPPPIYLNKGSVIPTEWKAEDVSQVAVNTPSIAAPERNKFQSQIFVIPKQDVLNARLSSSLLAAKFEFHFFEDALKTITSPSGQCRFYVECNAAGDVEHILRLSSTTRDASIFERALMLGKAKTPVSGWVDIEWMTGK
ncbi:MAG: hypothetical protein WCP12_15755 [bacterium]